MSQAIRKEQGIILALLTVLQFEVQNYSRFQSTGQRAIVARLSP